MVDLYKEVRRKRVVADAWAHIRANGLVSKCAETRKEVEEFDRDYPRHLERIARQLREDRFRFAPSRAVLRKRPGKKPRPIVVAPLPARIVQRALLSVLQRQDGLLPFLLSPSSFGGVKTRGVPEAIAAVLKAEEDGARYYIRSDVKDFFPGVQKEIVLKIIAANIPPQQQFTSLLEGGVEVELSNLAALGQYADLFPTHEIGVAQGNCLSVLIGNILLYDFDRQLAGRGITCIRYIDDFIVLGPDRWRVRKAFANGLAVLMELGLHAYHPDEKPTKAQEGWIEDGCEFLGCRMVPGLRMPTRQAQMRVKEAVETLFHEGEQRLTHVGERGFDVRRQSVVAVLRQVSRVMSGWVDQYHFCNDENFRKTFDVWLENRAQRYLAKAGMSVTHRDREAALRLLGIRPCVDGKRRSLPHAGGMAARQVA